MAASRDEWHNPSIKTPSPTWPTSPSHIVFPSFPQPFPFTMFSAYLDLAAIPSDAHSRTHRQQPDRDHHLHGPYHHLLSDVLRSPSAFRSLSLIVSHTDEGPCRDGYTVELVNISNINDIYAQMGTFSITKPVSSSVSVVNGVCQSEW